MEGLIQSEHFRVQVDSAAVLKALGERQEDVASPDFMSTLRAARLLERAGYDLKDPSTLLNLLGQGIRFHFFPFVEAINLIDAPLEKIFPLLSNTLWHGPNEARLLYDCSHLRQIGHGRVVTAIEQLPQVVQHFRHMRFSDWMVDNLSLMPVSLDGPSLSMILAKRRPDTGATLLRSILRRDQKPPPNFVSPIDTLLLKHYPLTLRKYVDRSADSSVGGPGPDVLSEAIKGNDVERTVQLLGKRVLERDQHGNVPFHYATKGFLNDLLHSLAAKKIWSKRTVRGSLVAGIVCAENEDGILLLLEKADMLHLSLESLFQLESQMETDQSK
jgi:hypothetical protein